MMAKNEQAIWTMYRLACLQKSSDDPRCAESFQRAAEMGEKALAMRKDDDDRERLYLAKLVEDSYKNLVDEYSLGNPYLDGSTHSDLTDKLQGAKEMLEEAESRAEKEKQQESDSIKPYVYPGKEPLSVPNTIIDPELDYLKSKKMGFDLIKLIIKESKGFYRYEVSAFSKEKQVDKLSGEMLKPFDKEEEDDFKFAPSEKYENCKVLIIRDLRKQGSSENDYNKRF